GADQGSIGRKRAGHGIAGALVGGGALRSRRRGSGGAERLEQGDCITGVVTQRIKTRGKLIPLVPLRGITNAQPVVERERPGNFPAILRIPLEEIHLQIGMRTRARLCIAVEVADERVGISVSCAAKSSSEGAAGAEVKCSGPVASRSLAIAHVLQVVAYLEDVRAAIDGQIIGHRRQNVIVACFSPAVEPVDVGGPAGDAGPAGNSGNGAQLIGGWVKLRGGVM